MLSCYPPSSYGSQAHGVKKGCFSLWEKKKKSCRVDKETRERNCKSSDGKLLMPSLWETASRQKKGLTWREGSKTEIKALMPKLLGSPRALWIHECSWEDC